MQWLQEKVQRDKLGSTKLYTKTKYRVTRIRQKTGGERYF